MAPNTQDNAGDDDDGKTASKTAVWIGIEVETMLTGLADKKTTHMSGNGFKPQVWPSIVTNVQRVNPDAIPKKDKQKCMNKLNYVRRDQFCDPHILTSLAAEEDF
jgi:hypothetical protein